MQLASTAVGKTSIAKMRFDPRTMFHCDCIIALRAGGASTPVQRGLVAICGFPAYVLPPAVTACRCGPHSTAATK